MPALEEAIAYVAAKAAIIAIVAAGTTLGAVGSSRAVFLRLTGKYTLAYPQEQQLAQRRKQLTKTKSTAAEPCDGVEHPHTSHDYRFLGGFDQHPGEGQYQQWRET